jgi:hypothetical protein
MVVLVTLLGVAVGLLALLVAGLLRSHAEILRALHELGVNIDPAGAPALAPRTRPGVTGRVVDVEGTDPDGAPIVLATGNVEHATLLAFLSSTCLTCREFWDAFQDHTLDVPLDARVIAVTRGKEAESPSTVRALTSPLVHTVMSTATWEAYQVPGAPYFVLIDGPTARVIGEGTAATWPQVRNLMTQAVADRDEPRTVNRALRSAGIEPGDPSLYPEENP